MVRGVAGERPLPVCKLFSSLLIFLVGGFNYFWNFHPENWGKLPNLTHIFGMG